MILDTSAYSNLQRGSASAIESIKGVRQLYLPLPVIGELKGGFVNGAKPGENNNRLERFMAQPAVEVLCPDMQTTEHYAELYTFAKERGRVLSHNDLWIAALARQRGIHLLTFDKDFEMFRDILTAGLTIA